MHYEPLEKVRKELKVRWIRPRIDSEKLQKLSERSDAQGWFQPGKWQQAYCRYPMPKPKKCSHRKPHQ